MKKTLLLIVIILPLLTNAQRWKYKRYHLTVGVGTAHFLGDFGGGAKDAAHFFGVRDIDFKYTRPTIQLGLKYRILQELSIKPTITYGYLKADDAESQEIGRKGRNLHFASNLWELGMQIEYSFIKEKEMARYTFSSLRQWRRLGAYIILGGGAFYFNPKAKYTDGTWTDLQPLHTEGQGHEPFQYTWKDSTETWQTITVTPNKPYQKFALFLNTGLGIIYSIDRTYAIGIEITNRYTSTDYLDDAHDRYYAEYDINSEDELESKAAYFADRHLVYSWALGDYGDPYVTSDKAPNYPSGYPQRGDPVYNDAYVFTIITGYYKMKHVIKSIPKF